MNIKQRILNFLIALDQLLFNLLTLGRGAPNETASAAAWRLEQTGHWAGRFFRPVIDGVFFFDPGHCRDAYTNLMAGKHLPAQINTNPPRG